jgi:hypothetical protein
MPMPRSDVEAGSEPPVGDGLDAPLLNGAGRAAPAEPVELVSHKGLAGQFSWLGWAAFGGPSAHVSLFQKVSALPQWGAGLVADHHVRLSDTATQP